jgi:hypothetical protein
LRSPLKVDSCSQCGWEECGNDSYSFPTSCEDDGEDPSSVRLTDVCPAFLSIENVEIQLHRVPQKNFFGFLGKDVMLGDMEDVCIIPIEIRAIHVFPDL